MSIYDYSIQDANGNDVPLKNYKGKVLLIVNTATKCGFTPQYKELEHLYETYHDKGLEIIDVPCNQFGEQTPGTNSEISEFCTLNYNTKFPQMKKSDVNGTNELPLYTYLKTQKKFEGFGESKTAQILADYIKKINPVLNRRHLWLMSKHALQSVYSPIVSIQRGGFTQCCIVWALFGNRAGVLQIKGTNQWKMKNKKNLF